jgi:hypothetical protein
MGSLARLALFFARGQTIVSQLWRRCQRAFSVCLPPRLVAWPFLKVNDYQLAPHSGAAALPSRRDAKRAGRSLGAEPWNQLPAGPHLRAARPARRRSAANLGRHGMARRGQAGQAWAEPGAPREHQTTFKSLTSV